MENTSKVQIAIKYSNIMNFFKIPIGVETRVDDLHFVSWSQAQKILYLRKNLRFRVRSNNFPKHIEMHIL